MAPRLDFTPALSTTTHIPFTHAVSNSLPFKIQVRVSRAWYDKLHAAGRQIQVWSDMHIGRRGEQQWGETPFVLPSDDLASSSATKSPAQTSISLLSSDEDDQIPRNDVGNDTSKDVTLVASFLIPNSQARYAFTFRIAGPLSHMEWLGNMGSNGILLVGRDGRRVGFEAFGDEGTWNLLEGSWESSVKRKEEEKSVAVGCLRDVEMLGWALGSDGSVKKVAPSSTVTSNLFILHPKTEGTRNATLPLFIHSRDPITLGDAGLVTVSLLSRTAVRVFVCEFDPTRTFSDVRNVINQATGGAFELISMPPKPSKYLVVKTHATAAYPRRARLHVIPTSSVLPASSRLTLSLEKVLLDTFPNEVSNYLFYSPGTNDALFIDHARIHSSQAGLDVMAGRDGGEILITPSYAVTEEEQSWRVAMVTPEVTDVTRETILPVLEEVEPPVVIEPPVIAEAPVNHDNVLSLEEDAPAPASALPTPPPSVPAALYEASLSRANSDVGADEDHDEGITSDAPITEPAAPAPLTALARPTSDALVLRNGPRAASMYSLRSLAIASLLTLWLRVFSIFRFLLLLRSGRGPSERKGKKVESSTANRIPDASTLPLAHVDTDSAPEPEPVLVPEPAQQVAQENIPQDTPVPVESVAPMEEHRIPEDIVEEKLDSSCEDTRTAAATILTPPLTPPPSLWPALAPTSTTKHLLQFTLSASTEPTPIKCVVFHPSAGAVSVNLQNDMIISVDGERLDLEGAKNNADVATEGVWWLVDGVLDGSIDGAERQVIISV